jgi:hypothetical protein
MESNELPANHSLTISRRFCLDFSETILVVADWDWPPFPPASEISSLGEISARRYTSELSTRFLVSSQSLKEQDLMSLHRRGLQSRHRCFLKYRLACCCNRKSLPAWLTYISTSITILYHQLRLCQHRPHSSSP